MMQCMDFLRVQALPNIKLHNYRIKICVNFLKNDSLIQSYNDTITDEYLLKKINDIIRLLRIYKFKKISYAYFHKSNFNNNYGILFALTQYNEEITDFFNYLLLNDRELIIIGYTIINKLKQITYHTKAQRLGYRYYDFIWPVSIDGFIQVNPETANQVHDTVDRLLVRNSTYVYYGLGGEMAVYAKKYEKEFKDTLCITNSEIIRNDYLANMDNSKCSLVDYNTVKLDEIFVDPNSVLLVNISRHGLRNLAKQINILKFKQIIYIGCCDEAIIRDHKELIKSYNLNKIIKINQFPETCYFLYIIEYQCFN